MRHTASKSDYGAHGKEDWATVLYRRFMTPMMHSAKWRYTFILAIVLLLLAAVSLVPLKLVQVKMLPFDNKSEFQVIVDMPNGTTLEQTTRVAQALGQYLSQQPEVANYQLYAGLSGPYNFNGLVRHYYLRAQPNQADIQVNLLPLADRNTQSHQIAKRLRPELQKIGLPYGARIKVSEVPPGPPVVQTLVAEVYGPDAVGQIEVANRSNRYFSKHRTLSMWIGTSRIRRLSTGFLLTRERPHFTGYLLPTFPTLCNRPEGFGCRAPSLTDLARGYSDHGTHEACRPLLPRCVGKHKVDRTRWRAYLLAGDYQDGAGDLAPSIYHKNMKRVVYVTGDVAGKAESPVYAIFKMNEALDRIKLPAGYALKRYNAVQPESTDRYAMKWDGEWHITIEVFRDLGLAFGAALILIYVLVVGWFRSFIVPFVIMAPIPLTLVGILPAHAMLGAFFTATSMIGFIAGAGIIVRNSIILVDFIELRRAQGMELADAVVDAGVVRFRPMLLTAAAVVVGASVILSDPIFQGLALSLMAGEVASTLLSRMAVPFSITWWNPDVWLLGAVSTNEL